MESDSTLFGNQGNAYPVDLPSQDYNELSPDSEYLESLKADTKYFRLPSGAEVKVTHENIDQLRLFGEDDPPHSVMVLHKPEDETEVVALYTHRKWWPISDVLKTSSKSRNGLVFVESVIERVILFLLNQIVFGMLERPLGEPLYFSTHSMSEYGKVFWQDGEATGFYTIKKKGSLCSGCTVCQKYLEIHQEQRERLYEVVAPGDWSQRRSVWLSIQLRRTKHISDESPHMTQATERQLIDTKCKSREGMTQIDGFTASNMKPSRPRRSCVKKRSADQAETACKRKSAKIS